MADNIRDVYSVVFTSLGEEKLIQQLNRVKKAADDMKHSLTTIQNLPGMNVEAGANASKLKSALKAVMDYEKIKQAAILKTEEVILKSDIKTAESQIKTAQKVSESLASNSLKFIALKQKETQAKIEAERLYNQQFQKLLADEKEARAKMAAYVAADVAKDKAAKLKAADEYRQAFAKLQVQEIAAAQKAAEEKFKIQQAYSLKTIQMNEWQKQAFSQRTAQQLQDFFGNKAMTANNAAAMTSFQNIATSGAEFDKQMKLFAAKVQAAEAEKQRLATTRQQTAELSKQLSLTTKITNGIVGMKKGLQKLATDSFVFQRMFDSITRTIDEWSKANIAMSQFRSQAGFENMNRQLNETVTNLGHVISKYEMIPAINKAKMLGFDFSGNKLSETLAMTTKVAQMFNIDPTKAFADFTVAITKASPIIMDNVGVLLRLEEAYRINYETTYKGVDAYDKWEKKLTQAQKREIYYIESMKQFAKKTEGFIVMTNKAQSAIMRLRDAWLGLGNDLSDSGGLNPAIFLIEKVVSLFEALGRSIYQLSNQFQALINNNPLLQKLLNFMTGSTGVGFVGVKNMQDVQEQYKYQMPITQSNAAKSKALLEQVAINPIRKMQEAIKNELKYEEMWNKNALTQVWNKKAVDRAMNYKTKIKELTAALNELNEAEKKITDTSDKEFVDRIMQGGILNLGDLLSKSSQVVKKYELQAPSFDKMGGYSRFVTNLYENILPDSAAQWINNGKPLGNFMADYQAGQKAVQDLNKEFANSNLVLSGVVNKYKEVDEALTGYIKTNREDLKLSAEKFKEITKLEKLGAEFALAVEKKGLTGDIGYQRREEVRNLLTQYNPNVKAEGEDMYLKFFKSYGVARDEDFTDAETGLIKIIGVGDKVEKLEVELKDKLYKILNNREMVDEIVAKYKLAQEAGSAYGVLKNITTYLDPLKEKKETTGRSKAPKEFWDKWYEMNRTAFTETLPEGITRDIEQARLDWFDQVKNLENLKKDILQAKEKGRLDPEERKKFFGESGVDKTVFEGQMSMYRKTIEDNYRKMLDNLAEELKRKQEELNPFQQFVKDKFTEELTMRGDLLTKGGIIGSPQGNPNAVINKYKLYDVQSELNMLKVAEEKKKISNEYYETQKRIKTEIQAQYAIDVQKLQSEKEWTDTRDFHIRLSALQSEYAVKEKEAMDSLNSQYKERLGYTNSLLHNVDLLNSAIDYQLEQQRKITDEVYKQGDIVAKYNRENMKTLSAMANKNMDITAYGFNAMGFGETEQSIAMKQANMQEKIYKQMASSSQFRSVAQRMMTVKTDTAFNFELDPSKMIYSDAAKKILMTDEEKARFQQDAEAMVSIAQSAANGIIQAVTSAADVWKGMLQEMFSNVANFAGNTAWNAITGEDVSGVKALREARKTDLKDQQENLKNKSITQETYAKRAYEIEKTYIENKKAAEKNYRNEQWKQLGAVFWAQGMGYMIKGGIDMFINPTAGQAELTGGAALMALGAMLGYGRGGKKAMSKANMAEESKATKQDINVYVDNKIFEDKRQLRQAINNASI